MLTGSKLNGIEGKISEALINNEISHEDFTAIINEEIKESIRMMKSQKSDTEKGKKIGIDKVIKRNEIVNDSLKSQI